MGFSTAVAKFGERLIEKSDVLTIKEKSPAIIMPYRQRITPAFEIIIDSINYKVYLATVKQKSNRGGRRAGSGRKKTGRSSSSKCISMDDTSWGLIDDNRGKKPRGKFISEQLMKTLAIIILGFLTLSSYADAPSRTLVLRTGEVIEVTDITSIDARSVHYKTANGCGSVEISDLTKEEQKALSFDPDAAAKADAAEKQREANSDAIAARVDAASQAVVVAVAPPVAPSAVPTSSLAKPTISDSERASIQSQIDSLQADVEQKQAIDNKRPSHYTKGAYGEIIINEKAQIADLKARL